MQPYKIETPVCQHPGDAPTPGVESNRGEEIAYSVFSAEERSRSFQLAMLRGLLLLQGPAAFCFCHGFQLLKSI